MAAADMNQDRFPDLVAAKSFYVRVLLNDKSWPAPTPPFGMNHDILSDVPAIASVARSFETNPQVVTDSAGMFTLPSDLVDTGGFPARRVKGGEGRIVDVFPEPFLGSSLASIHSFGGGLRS
jgi:hypothetical protein